MSESLMTDTSATTTEAATASESAAGQPQGQPAATQQQATDGSNAPAADAAKGDGEGGKQGDEAKVYGAPEKYEFQAPEGMDLEEAGVSAFSEFAKEANLSQEAAQALLNKMAPAMAQRQAAALEQARTEWAETSKADTEFGGAKLNENLAVAKKALETFGSPELRTLLNESGLGNHPEIIRAFYRAGKAISEDSFVPAGKEPKGNSAGRDYAKALYPNQ